ncbi:MAG TPA: S41 family peptidase [Gillisia sp.]|nr:S41 family peptidase [Gillisia sp.]
MKVYKLLLLTLLMSGLLYSCSEDRDDLDTLPPGNANQRDLTVENFVWRGLNEIYLYKSDVPQLADNFFATQALKDDFLDNYATPKELFDNGLTAPQDNFSFIVADYSELEASFAGISKTTGMNYNLSYISGTDNLFGFVRYVLPNTSAETQGIKRGNLFTKVNGTQLNINNYQSLLASPTVTLTMATLDGNTLIETGETKTLTNAEYNSNPVYIKNVLTINGSKVGYLMYNSFTRDYDKQLNDAFGEFKAAGITDLILDLRYNGGGSVRTATDLASMITGQFPGEIFMKEVWNEEYQAYFESTEERKESLLNRFNTKILTGETINSLNLTRVFVLTTKRSASASELIINGLKPYIEVIQVGDRTTGKFTASVTLYDSPNFGKANANTTHKYAMQPLVLKSVNAAGVSDFVNGLAPDHLIVEAISTYGVLGDENEPLLKVALDVIKGNRVSIQHTKEEFKSLGESSMFNLDYQKMYIDKIPPVIDQDEE